MKIAAIGGSGFIGSHIVSTLRAQGHELAVIDIANPSYSQDNLKFFKYDIFENGSLERILREIEPELVISLVGLADARKCHEDPRLGFMLNVQSVEIVWNTLRFVPSIERSILISTASVYGNTSQLPVNEEMKASPTSIYGWQKLVGEELAQGYSAIYNPNLTIVRLFNVYGKGQAGIISHLINAGKTGQEFDLYGANQIRDFVYAGDVAKAISKIVESPVTKGMIFNVGSGFGMSIKEISLLVKDILNGLKVRIHEDTSSEHYDSVADISRLQHFTGWKPDEAKQTIKDVIINEMI